MDNSNIYIINIDAEKLANPNWNTEYNRMMYNYFVSSVKEVFDPDSENYNAKYNRGYRMDFAT